MKSIRAALVVILAFSGAIFVSFGASAGSQGTEPYVSPFGDLTIEAESLLPGSVVMLSGDGFTPAAPVFLTVRQNATADVVVEDEGEADGAGAVAFELELTENFVPGGYSATVRGTTIDGAILDLSGAFNIDAPATPTPVPEEPPSRPDPTPTTEPAARPTATPLPTPRPPITGPTPTPNGAVPTPSPTALPAAAGDDDDGAEVLGETVEDDDDAGSEDAASSGEASQPGDESRAGDGDAVAPALEGETSADPDAASGDDEIAAPAIDGSGGIGGAQVAGLIAAVLAIGGGAYAMYRRSNRPTPTHAE